MTSYIFFPEDLPLPIVSGGDSFENVRSRVEMEVGPTRQRRHYRTAPRRFTYTWEFTQAEYAEFDDWWQNAIQGSVLPFNIRLLDDDQSLLWFEVYWLGSYKSEIVDTFSKAWRVSGTLRIIGQGSSTRPVGTNNMHGYSKPEIMAVGWPILDKALRGQASFTLQNSGRLGAFMHGLSSPVLNTSGRLRVDKLAYGVSTPTITSTGYLTGTSAPSMDFSDSNNSGYVALF